MADGYKTTTWKGLPNYECEAVEGCQFKTLDARRMGDHLWRNHGFVASLQNAPRPVRPVELTSEESEAVARLVSDNKADDLRKIGRREKVEVNGTKRDVATRIVVARRDRPAPVPTTDTPLTPADAPAEPNPPVSSTTDVATDANTPGDPAEEELDE